MTQPARSAERPPSRARALRAAIRHWIDTLYEDARYAVRGLIRDRGFAVIVILTFALGLGAMTTTFSVADRVLLRPPGGVANPDGVRRLYLKTTWTVGQVPEITPEIFYPAAAAIGDAVGSRARVAPYVPPDTMPLTVGDRTSTVEGAYVSSEYFEVLGVHAAHGRLLDPQDNVMGRGAMVAVISDALWHRAFGGDSGVLGRTVTLAHEPYTIVGIAAPGFDGADLTGTDVWLPLATRWVPGDPTWYTNWRDIFTTHVLVRPAPGTSDAWLSAVGTTVYRRGMAEHEKLEPDTTATVMIGPILEARGPTLTPEPTTMITTRLLGVAALVLLIACANVANLLLVRAGRREHEMAIRAALGGSTGRLVRQMITESVVLALVAAAAAAIAAVWVGAGLRAMIFPAVGWRGPVVDGRDLAFAMGVAIATGLAAGIAPALRARRPDLMASLKDGAAAVGGAGGGRTRDVLMVVQVALAMVLLTGAGLFVESLRAVERIPLGYDLSTVVFGGAHFADSLGRVAGGLPSAADRALLTAGLPRVAKALAHDPDVVSVATTNAQPMAEYMMVRLYRGDESPAPVIANRDPVMLGVSPGFFRTTGLSLTRGRAFTDADDAHAPPVIIVNRTAAQRYWPGQNPLGQCLRFFRTTNPCSTVIGIAEDGHVRDLIEGPRAVVYVPFAQNPGIGLRWVIARARPGRVQAVRAAMRAALTSTIGPPATPRIMVGNAELQADYRPWRIGLILFGILGGVALVVAGIGVYGVIAYAMRQRLRDMGIRVALGAPNGHLWRVALAHGARTVLLGIAVGVALVLMLGRSLASLLYGVTPRDPWVMGGVAGVLAMVALIASLRPAWRATHTDPVRVLRSE